MHRLKDLGLGRIETVSQGRVRPKSLDATLRWGTIERAASRKVIRLDLHLGKITLAFIWRMEWRKQDWKQEEF